MVIGVIAFVVIDELITSVIDGTDTGSMLLKNLLRIVVSAAILVSVVMSLGRSK